MQRAIVVRGRLTDSQTVVLDEPVEGFEANVEVLLREVVAAPEETTGESAVAVVRRTDFEGAMRGDLDVELVGKEATGSSFVLARRNGATIPAGPPVHEETPPTTTLLALLDSSPTTAVDRTEFVAPAPGVFVALPAEPLGPPGEGLSASPRRAATSSAPYAENGPPRRDLAAVPPPSQVPTSSPADAQAAMNTRMMIGVALFVALAIVVWLAIR